ncbi:epidermal retinol dehydrogenase 2-like, partial [Diaphorina citri]|uniref:Epidermal retinol dehydrogenase 2-like n=1 Tax=Diaphorina citri TaxID=121845 RepID=A0A3Q0JI54_DIACI
MVYPSFSIVFEITEVTGAGHGIGRELAIQLADLGCTVVCVDLNQENNAKTADQINTTHNCKKAFPFEMDVTFRDQVMATRQKIFETVGAVDILINNAGIMTPQPILTAKPDDIVAVINVNLLAHFWIIAKGMMDALVEELRGPSPGMMDALVEELRGPSPGVKFTTVHPYFVNTRPDLPEHLHLRMPQLEPGFAAKEIIRAMLEEQEAVSIPRHLYFFAHLL